MMTLGMMLLIFHFSGENAELSSDLSGGICERLISFLNQKLHLGWNEFQIAYRAELVETPIRKCAHFTEYALLSICAGFHGFSLLLMKKGESFFAKNTQGKRRMIQKSLLYSCVFCIAYSISDEIHQYFVPGRACRFFDVCVDTGGIIAGALLVFFVVRCIFGCKRGKKEKIGDRFVY